MSRIQWRMANNVRCPCGTLLQKGERVEMFVAKWHRRRVTPAQMETARITEQCLQRRADGRPWLMPKTILRGSKLLVVERQHLTMLAIEPPTGSTPQERPRLTQMELLD